MKNIAELDKNLKIATEISESDIEFYDIRKPPFKIYGLFNPEVKGVFRRLPSDVSAGVSEGVDSLSKHTAGGRVRFRTNSKYIALKVMMDSVSLMPHMALAGSSGFDMYEKKNTGYIYKGTFMPGGGRDAAEKIIKQGGYESIIYFDNNADRDITINFPLYNNVNDVYIGIQEGAVLEAGCKYRDVLPIVYYGSSITQGGCASRPGNSYSAILSRRYDADYYNLGFSGNAKGEDEIAMYIADIPMSIFVYDYDHNAPNCSHLKKTHRRMYNIIREKNPELPIIIATRPKPLLTNEERERKKIIYGTYLSALNTNDNNVFFADGEDMLNIFGGDSGSVDGTHPNDLGFMCMAHYIGNIIDKIL